MKKSTTINGLAADIDMQQWRTERTQGIWRKFQQRLPAYIGTAFMFTVVLYMAYCFFTVVK